MEKSSQKKVTSKQYDVLPTAYHVLNPEYEVWIRIGVKNYWSEKTYPTKKEAWVRLEEMKQELAYDLIPTVQDEGYFPERAKLIREKYEASGRTNGLYSGLNMEDGQVSNNFT
jgi:hypothetical protein